MSRRYQPLGVETWGSRKVARVRDKITGGTLGYYMDGRTRTGRPRIVSFALDQPCKDETLRKVVRRLLEV